jgi:colanic acid/amylovoran biosynthesis protein
VRRILVETSNYHCTNLGDVAMLQVTVNRLRALWPAASVEVLSADPDALAKYCPGTAAIPWSGREGWLDDHALLGRLYRWLPFPAPVRSGAERALRRRWPSAFRAVLKMRHRLRGERRADLDAFLGAMARADLLVLTGAGGLTDHSRPWNLAMLDTLQMGLERGIPVAVFSQGCGPLHDAETMRRGGAVLSRAMLVALREGRFAPPLMEAMGVVGEHVIVTGDDAIELAYEARTSEAGTGLGINLRVARSAAVDTTAIEQVRPVLHEFASRHGAPLLPLPIARPSDVESIHGLLQGWSGAGGEGTADGGVALDTPRKIIEQAGRCRIVVTGAYHAAVFALSQGVPVVFLAKSAYFIDKFLGLGAQFGIDCEIVRLDSPTMREELLAAMARAWENADRLRQPLLDAAAAQVALSRSAYQRMHDLLSPAAQEAPAGSPAPRSVS